MAQNLPTAPKPLARLERRGGFSRNPAPWLRTTSCCEATARRRIAGLDRREAGRPHRRFRRTGMAGAGDQPSADLQCIVFAWHDRDADIEPVATITAQAVREAWQVWMVLGILRN